MASAGLKTTYTPVKKVTNSKSSLSCRLFDLTVVCNDGCYSLISENTQEYSRNEYLRKNLDSFRSRGRLSVRRVTYSL